jgi:hypothetical protein
VGKAEHCKERQSIIDKYNSIVARIRVLLEQSFNPCRNSSQLCKIPQCRELGPPPEIEGSVSNKNLALHVQPGSPFCFSKGSRE